MQATSDKTASANFTQTGYSTNIRGVAGNVTNGKDGYNNYYQFGRKDAFRSAQYTANPAPGTDLILVTEDATIGETIQNPTTHYAGKVAGSNNYYPYTPSYYNAWNATYTELAGDSTAKVDGLEKTVKTVYDPCPLGYTVPPANTFTAFNTTNFPVDGNGRTYTTSDNKELYFPYNYIRLIYTAQLGLRGYYPTSVYYNNNCRARSSKFELSGVAPVHDGLSVASGAPVHPVREK